MQNIEFNLNQSANLYFTVQKLSVYNTNTDINFRILFNSIGFVNSEIFPVLCSFLNEAKLNGSTVSSISDMEPNCSVSKYASRIDFFKNIGINFVEPFVRHTSDTFIEITNAPKDCYGIYNTFSKVFYKDFKFTPEQADSIGFFIDEMICNVTMHSKGSSGAYFYCQKYPTKEGLEVVIVDSGIGIAKSLSKKIKGLTNAEYLEESVKFGVTNGEGQGHGLYFLTEFIRRNSGTLKLWSGKNYIFITKGQQYTFDSNNWNGVILQFLIKFDIVITIQDLMAEKKYT